MANSGTPTAPKPHTTADWMLPGPPSRNNFGSLDLSPAGLLAFPSGSSITVLDSRSLQLIATVPLPPPQSSSSSSSSSSSLSPFITSVRWIPLSPIRDLLSTEPSSSYLLLAVADRHGRIAILDLHLKSFVLWLDPDGSKCGVQDLCWILFRPDCFALAAISGPSTLSLYTTSNASSNRCFFKYDASPEYLSCIHRDPFDSRHFCVIGFKGFLLSVKVLGDTEDDIALKEFQISTDFKDLAKLEKDAAVGSPAPASAVFPLYNVKFAFSPLWRHILFVTFPRELVVFDLKYETSLFSASLPRGCGKFLDVLPDPNNELLYCAHVDGKFSIWRRKEGEQVHVMCAMEELMPSIGTSVSSPSILAVTISQAESTLQSIAKLYSEAPNSPFSNVDFDNPFDFCDDTILLCKIQMISISDDGKIWNWLLTAKGTGETQEDSTDLSVVSNTGEVPVKGSRSDSLASIDRIAFEASKLRQSGGKSHSSSTFSQGDVSFKISLVGQLQLLSSTVTMLAVPTPSLTAILAR